MVLSNKEVNDAIAELIGPIPYAMVVRKFGGRALRLPKKPVNYTKLIVAELRLGCQDKKAIALKVGCTVKWVRIVSKAFIALKP